VNKAVNKLIKLVLALSITALILSVSYMTYWFFIFPSVVHTDFISPVGCCVPEGPDGQWAGWQVEVTYQSWGHYFFEFGYYNTKIYLYHVNGSYIYIPEWSEVYLP